MESLGFFMSLAEQGCSSDSDTRNNNGQKLEYSELELCNCI